ncbi:MAG: amidohydrolase family protein [Planctomycetota bacterium]
MNQLTTIAAALTLGAAATAPVLAQDLTHPAPPQENTIFLVGATLHTAAGDIIENSVVSFAEGKIGIVGVADQVMPRILLTDDTEVIDVSGHHISPGFIGSVTRLGLTEMAAVRAQRDFNEVGDATPEVRGYVAVNPDSALIPVARTNGVLTAGVFPTGGLIPGRASVIRMDGWTTEDHAIDRDAGVIINWPSMRPSRNRFDQPSEDAEQRIDQRIEQLSRWIDNATAYRELRAADPSTPADLRLAALTTILPARNESQQQNPVFINANDYDQIVAAVNWAAERELSAVIVGGRDAAMCTDLLKANNTPVIVTGVHRFPKRADSNYDDAFTLPARLETAGVRWCLASGAETGHERNLPDNAAMAVAYGLSPEAGLRAITANAADILGMGDTLGTIESGKAATLIVTTGHPLEITSSVVHAFIDGRTIDLTNKQTKLRDKYREKYQRLGVSREDE